MKELIERRKVIRALHSELERYDLIGFRPAEAAEKAVQLDALAEDMGRRIDELEDLGIHIKDLDYGLVDFPAERYGEKVFLCWRCGEPEVSYWHGAGDGYTGRKPLKMQLIQP